MSKAVFRFLLLLLCLFTAALPARAVDAPVDDLAGVFSPEYVTDLSSYAQRMREDLGIPFYVVTRHFLGGKNIQTYTNQALESLPDPGKAMLLVLVIGEEGYAVAIGDETREHLSPQKAEALLNDYFRNPYLKDRAYEKAVAAFALQAGAYLEGRLGVRMNAGALLSPYTAYGADEHVLPAIQQNDQGNIFGSIFENASKSREDAQRYNEDARSAGDDNEKGLSLFQIALIGFVLYRIFGRGNRRKDQQQKSGCGPLGWIMGAWGVSKFFGWRK